MKNKIIIGILAIIFSLGMIGSGWITQQGLILRGLNNTDGIWNIALIEELKHHFPPQHPGLSGVPLKGYHFLFHLVVATVSRITFIPSMFLYFQVFPLLISFFWGLGVYNSVFLLTKNKAASYISVIFSFFAGSFAFILHILGQNQMSIDSGFGISQPYSSALVNPAYASSVVLVIWSIFSYLQYTKTSNKKWLIFLAVLSGISVGFKVYAGMILVGALLVSSLWSFIFEKKIDLVLAFVGALCISLFVFYPFNGNYGFLVYAPFLHIIRMIEGPLNFTTWDELFHIQREIHNYFGMTKLFLLVFIIFLVGNVGTRIVSVMGYVASMKKQNVSTHIYMLSLITISLGIPIFFIQPAGGAFNINQMHWYFLFLLSIFVGSGIVYFVRKIKSVGIKYTLVCLFIVFTIPVFLDTLKSNISSTDISISSSKLELLRTLKNYGEYDDTVFIIPSLVSFEEFNIENWFWKESNVIIPAVASKRVFLANEVVSYSYEERFVKYELYETLEEVRKSCKNNKRIQEECIPILNQFINSLNTSQIKLLYVEKPFAFTNHSQLRQIKSNDLATIYEVLPL